MRAGDRLARLVDHHAGNILGCLQQEELLIPGEPLRTRGAREDQSNRQELPHSINSENGRELTLKMPSNGLSVSVITRFDKNRITASSTKQASPTGNE